jgi:Sucrase/ferredoxin-like
VTDRCSDTSRGRGESPIATAPPARRLLLLDVPGPWGRAGLTGSRLAAGVTVPLAAAADAAGVRVQLLRAPGRHPGPVRPHPLSGRQVWALADPDAGVVRWGSWSREPDLLEIDLAERLDQAVHAGSGPQRLALVCTHARHDLCCAVRGRPVAAALAAAGLDREVWETSHLGGDRFAANLLLLPEGEVFGGLDEDDAVAAVRALDGGRLALPHYRGRVGRAPVVQAALHLAAAALDDDRRGAVRVLAVSAAGPGPRPGEQRFEARVQHRDRVHRVQLVEWWASPERLTCAAVEAKPARRYTLTALDRELDHPLDQEVG